MKRNRCWGAISMSLFVFLCFLHVYNFAFFLIVSPHFLCSRTFAHYCKTFSEAPTKKNFLIKRPQTCLCLLQKKRFINPRPTSWGGTRSLQKTGVACSQILNPARRTTLRAGLTACAPGLPLRGILEKIQITNHLVGKLVFGRPRSRRI